MAIIPYENNDNDTSDEGSALDGAVDNDISSYRPREPYRHNYDNRPIARIHNNVRAVDAALEGIGAQRHSGSGVEGSDESSNYSLGGLKLRGEDQNGNSVTWTVVPNFDSDSPSFLIRFSDVDPTTITESNADRVWDLATIGARSSDNPDGSGNIEF